TIGAAAILVPLLSFTLAWQWIRSDGFDSGAVTAFAGAMLRVTGCAGLSFAPVRLFGGNIRIGGALGYWAASYLVESLNVAGAILATITLLVVSIYLVSTFSLDKLAEWCAGPIAWFHRRAEAWREWRERVHARSLE